MKVNSRLPQLFSPTGFRIVSKIGRRAGGYGSSIALSTLVNLAVVPIVIAVAGSAAWGGIAVSQSIASFGFVLVAFGWGITGPSAVAGLGEPARGQFFVDSVITRAYLFVLVAPLVLISVWVLSPGNTMANQFAALALLLPALGSSWFFVGERRPWRLFFMENVPRALGTALGAVLLVLTRDIVWFAVSQSLGSIFSTGIAVWDVMRRHPRYRAVMRLRPALGRLRDQASGMIAAGTAALYVSLPLVLVALLVPQATAVYALADKLLRFSVAAYSPVIQIAQGYVPDRDPAIHRSKAELALKLSLGLGLVAGGGYMLLAPWGASVLSAGAIVVSWSLAAPLGLALAAIAVSAVVGWACLTSFGAVKKVAVSTVLGVLFGAPLLVFGGLWFGLVGIAWATAASELIVALYQIGQLRRFIRRPVAPAED